ncbi:hypothetical protein DFH06DRAFT_1319053 [Mycena polygramma]|nr:hypothetical protein DFH06DRAFT_1319053 [Mycena polygramma]
MDNPQETPSFYESPAPDTNQPKVMEHGVDLQKGEGNGEAENGSALAPDSRLLVDANCEPFRYRMFLSWDANFKLRRRRLSSVAALKPVEFTSGQRPTDADEDDEMPALETVSDSDEE